MKALSSTHNVVLIALAIVVAVRLRRLEPLVVTVVTMLAANRLDTVLKDVIGRPRPPLADPAVHPLIALPHDPSMPSGHAMTTFAAVVVLLGYAPRWRPWLLLYAALVALSRPYLGVHYPSDVLAGAAIGAALGLGVLVVLRRLVHPQIRARHHGERGNQREPNPERGRDVGVQLPVGQGEGEAVGAVRLGDDPVQHEQRGQRAGAARDHPRRHGQVDVGDEQLDHPRGEPDQAEQEDELGDVRGVPSADAHALREAAEDLARPAGD